jgi:hypothetical protein
MAGDVRICDTTTGVGYLPSVAYGPGQTPVTNSSSGAATALTATLAAVAGKTNYIGGFEVTGAGATAGSVIAVTVTGILGGTLNYVLAIPTGATVGTTPLVVDFNPNLPASAVNTAITVNVPSFGAGNTNAAVTVHGFYQ